MLHTCHKHHGLQNDHGFREMAVIEISLVSLIFGHKYGVLEYQRYGHC